MKIQFNRLFYLPFCLRLLVRAGHARGGRLRYPALSKGGNKAILQPIRAYA